MAVRPATEADLDEIVALIRELAVYEQLEADVSLERDEVGQHLFGEQPAAHVLIAESDGGDVAGFALWFTTFSTFLGRPGIWLEDLFVRPAHRGRGHGLALLQRLRAMTDARVEWSVLDWNEPAIGFYRALGAKPVEGWTTYRWLPS
ncbi:MAG TPA: GNAT family N-acetyltransferase [Acidimicrobiales bacterium]